MDQLAAIANGFTKFRAAHEVSAPACFADPPAAAIPVPIVDGLGAYQLCDL
jgi:hypothetical protein